MTCQLPVEPTQKENKIIDMNCSCPYPLDFWFEISCYIDPEDVERFARICKHCTSVVKSTSFWLSLYRRFYRSDIPLPQCLQPASMTQRHGLRARVIRALYFLYMPMTRKLQDTSVTESRLLNKMCVQQCHKYHFAIGCATFIFKFQDVNYIPIRGQESNEKTDDINANKDEGAITLKLTCSQITTPPLVLIGLVLRSIKLPTPADPGGRVHISVGDNFVETPPKEAAELSAILTDKNRRGIGKGINERPHEVKHFFMRCQSSWFASGRKPYHGYGGTEERAAGAPAALARQGLTDEGPHARRLAAATATERGFNRLLLRTRGLPPQPVAVGFQWNDSEPYGPATTATNASSGAELPVGVLHGCTLLSPRLQKANSYLKRCRSTHLAAGEFKVDY